MKFLRDRSFKRLSWYILGFVILLFVGEFFLIRNSINNYRETEARKDLARRIQLETQELNLIAQKYNEANRALTNEIATRVDRINHHLNLLKTGGRIDGSNVFLSQLSRLPMITFENAEESWKKYSASIMVLLTEEAKIDTTIVVQPDPADTVHQSPYTTEIQFANARYKTASTLLESQAVSLTSWYQKLLADIDDEADSAYSSLSGFILWLLIIDIIFVGVILFLFNRKIIAPINKLGHSIASGKVQTDIPSNEIGKLAKTANDLLIQLEDASTFVSQIGEGKLDVTYTQRMDGNGATTNSLAEALLGMQDKLRAMSEEEKRRQWATEGLTRFVDILRSSDDNISRLGDEIIAALVKYTNSNQGGLYILNDEDEQRKYLELVAMFAFDTKKFQQQQIRLGEGVLGQTFLEKETTLLTEIPDDYVKITSGLGDGGPRAILMVPLKVDQNVYGMVELATFNSYKPHEIAFVEKLGETIASTLASVKAAQKNKHLIEQFQEQTEVMRAQEEEMRQNMEELTATQEEMSRKERDYIDRIKELESTNGNNSTADLELQRTRNELAELRERHTSTIEQLQRKLDAKPARSDDWAVAEEVERTLKTNLEALKITQEELSRKTGEN
jgi:HAMP domain-containing protein/putative methionine-R-sulfoxide reductase with GAF domain